VACSCYPLHFFRECREAATIAAMLPQTANLCVVFVSAIVKLLVFEGKPWRIWQRSFTSFVLRTLS
jgi:hypothetical protein